MTWITGDAGELINLSRIAKIDVVPNDTTVLNSSCVRTPAWAG
jgi:hypothetical protein